MHVKLELSAPEIRELADEVSGVQFIDNCNILSDKGSRVVVTPPSTDEEKLLYYRVSRRMLPPLIQYKSLPHPAFANLGRNYNKCIKEHERPGLLFERLPGAHRKFNKAGYQVIVIPAGTQVFKGTRYFYDALDETKLPYMWVGNSELAMFYASRYSGGCMVFEITRPMELFVLSYENCKRLHAKTKWDSVSTPDARNALELKMGVGIPLAEQAERVKSYLKSDELLIYRSRPHTRFTYCASPEKSRLFGAAVNDHILATFLREQREKLGGIHGWFSPQNYSPFHCALPEEMLVFTGTGHLSTNDKHPLWWRNWLDALPLDGRGLPKGDFDLDPKYYLANRNFAVLKMVTRHQDSELTQTISKSFSSKISRKPRFISWNVFGLHAPNALLSTQQVANQCAKLCKIRGAHVVVLQRVPIEHRELLQSEFWQNGRYKQIACTDELAGNCMVCFAKASLMAKLQAHALSQFGIEIHHPELGNVFAVDVMQDLDTYMDGHFTMSPLNAFVAAYRANIKKIGARITLLYRKSTLPHPRCLLGVLGAEPNIAKIIAKSHRPSLVVEDDPKIAGSMDMHAHSHLVMLEKGSLEARAQYLPFVNSYHLPFEVNFII